MKQNKIISFKDATSAAPHIVEDYTLLLRELGMPYTIKDGFIQYLTIMPDGIMIHMSTVLFQISDLLRCVLPILKQHQIPFVLVANLANLELILNGHKGFEQLGKVATFYFPDKQLANLIAAKLMAQTSAFSGPKIYGTLPINGVMYCPEIFAHQFAGLIMNPKHSKAISNRYRITETLKEDVKGNVYLAVYTKSLLNTGYCVIKQGIANLWSDVHGRTIRDRLLWQKELQEKLAPSLRVPRVLDCYLENGDTFLVMEHIKGLHLEMTIRSIYGDRYWQQLQPSEQLIILDYLLQVADLLRKMHAQGIAHRDLTPANFIVDINDLLYTIDLEMAVNVVEGKPNPQFSGGTPGFMSPQQFVNQRPELVEDIYGFGALMLDCFTNMPPVKISTRNTEQLMESIRFFIQDENMVRLVAACLLPSTQYRPSIEIIIQMLSKFREEISLKPPPSILPLAAYMLCYEECNKMIRTGFLGLLHPAFASNDKIFARISATDERINHRKFSIMNGGGLECPIAGLILLLSNRGSDDDVDEFTRYLSGQMNYLTTSYLARAAHLPPGLKAGTAGMCWTLGMAIETGLLNPEIHFGKDMGLLINMDTTELDVASGIAGQGLVLLTLDKIMDQHYREVLMDRCLQHIMMSQNPDGSWPAGRKGHQFSLADGDAGILYFLLSYYEHFPDERLRQAILIGLEYLSTIAHTVDGRVSWTGNRTHYQIDRSLGYGDSGIALTFIKAHGIFGTQHYRDLVESVFKSWNERPVWNNYSLLTGISGLGLVYLEAAKTFEDKYWLERAGWIASLLKHSIHIDELSRGYWNMDGTNNPDGSLLTGTIGAMLFLIKFRAAVTIQ